MAIKNDNKKKRLKVFILSISKWLKQRVLNYSSFRSKIQYNNHNFDAKHFDDNKKITDKIEKIVEKRKLDPAKNENILKIVNSINENHTVIGVSGQQGSGKSSVITTATKDIFLPKKGVFNRFVIFVLYCLRYLSVCIFITRAKKKISRRIAFRRWKYVNINLWSLFGQRDLKEYLGIERTAYKSNVSKTIDGKIEKHSRISSFDNESKKVSWIFVKKVIWRSIFAKVRRVNPFTFRLINSLFSSSYSVNAEKSKLKLMLMNLLLILFIFIFVYGILFVILSYTTDLKLSQNAGISVSSIFPASLFHIILKNSVKGIVVKEENDFFVDPISNIAIENYLKRITKCRVIILHISEIDRLYNKVPNSNFVRYIVESITMGYTAKNVNIIFEIDSKIEEILSENDSFIDTKNKLFKSMVYVRAFDLESFSSFSGITGNKKVIMKEYFQEIGRDSYMGSKSWRAWERHLSVFNKFLNKKYFSYDSESKIRSGFSAAFRPFAMDEFCHEKRDSTKNTEIIMKDGPSISFGGLDKNEDAIIGTFMMMINPHLIHHTSWYPGKFLSSDYQKYFIENVVPSLVGMDAFSTRLMGYIVTNLPDKDLKMIFDSLEFKGLWKWEPLDSMDFDIEAFFKKLPGHIKTKALESLDASDVMKNDWIINFYKSSKKIFPPSAIMALRGSGNIVPLDYYDNESFIAKYFEELENEDKKEVIKLLNSNIKVRSKLWKEIGKKGNKKINAFDIVNSKKVMENKLDETIDQL